MATLELASSTGAVPTAPSLSRLPSVQSIQESLYDKQDDALTDEAARYNDDKGNRQYLMHDDDLRYTLRKLRIRREGIAVK